MQQSIQSVQKIVIPNLLSNIVFFFKVLLNPKKYNSFCKVACRVGNLKKKESKILKKTSFLVNSIVEILVSYKFFYVLFFLVRKRDRDIDFLLLSWSCFPTFFSRILLFFCVSSVSSHLYML